MASNDKKNTEEKRHYDIIVVGGGPAGMMVAGTASRRGLRVLLLEKNDHLGKKLLITGGGRCNVTNNTPDSHVLLPRYGEAEQFLYSSFAQFGVNEALDFFHERTMETKIENEGRVFPKSNTAKSVWEVMVNFVKKHAVVIACGSPVTELIVAKGVIQGVRTAGGTTYLAREVVIATGGTSKPETGSTGDGFRWLKKAGHRIVLNGGALVPVAVNDEWVKKLSGIALADVMLTIMIDGKKKEKKRGKLLFTHFGLSGPALLNLSSAIGLHLKNGEVSLTLDLLPETTSEALDKDLSTHLRNESNKQVKNALSSRLALGLIKPILSLAIIPANKPCHSVTRTERLRLVKCIKGAHISVSRLMGLDMAVATGGGVPLDEIDMRTMESKKVHGLFLVGDLLNIDRPSGGYSLQLCWTTGYVAGMSVGNKGQ